MSLFENSFSVFEVAGIAEKEGKISKEVLQNKEIESVLLLSQNNY
jgi:hypothetical protein